MKCGSEDNDTDVYFDDVRGGFVRIDDNRSMILWGDESDDDVLTMPELDDADVDTNDADEAGEELERST